jgi:hypothetical protein
MKKEDNYELVIKTINRFFNKALEEPLYFIVIQCLVKKRWFSQRTKFWTEKKITDAVNKHLTNAGEDEVSETEKFILWLVEEEWIEKFAADNRISNSQSNYRITDFGNELIIFLRKILKLKKKHKL